eukprot:620681-Pelagomonas_calceolata.AAC.3
MHWKGCDELGLRKALNDDFSRISSNRAANPCSEYMEGEQPKNCNTVPARIAGEIFLRLFLSTS